MSYKRWQKRKAPRVHHSMTECERFGDYISRHKLYRADYDFWWKDEWDHSINNRSWKDNSKRRRQYKRVVSITLLPGYAVMSDNDAYIIPFDEVITY